LDVDDGDEVAAGAMVECVAEVFVVDEVDDLEIREAGALTLNREEEMESSEMLSGVASNATNRRTQTSSILAFLGAMLTRPWPTQCSVDVNSSCW
jgi:hypothetical protein